MDNKIINQIVTSLAADIKVGDTIYFIDRYVNIHRICPTCNGSTIINAVINKENKNIRCPDCHFGAHTHNIAHVRYGGVEKVNCTICFKNATTPDVSVEFRIKATDNLHKVWRCGDEQWEPLSNVYKTYKAAKKECDVAEIYKN